MSLSICPVCLAWLPRYQDVPDPEHPEDRRARILTVECDGGQEDAARHRRSGRGYKMPGPPCGFRRWLRTRSAPRRPR